MDTVALIISILPAFLRGSVVTLGVTASALAIGAVLGAALGLAEVYGGRPVSWLATLSVNVVRALPPLVALFLFYFVVGSIVDLPPLAAGVLALAASTAAFQAEILRGAIQSVGESQMVAARAVGMTQRQSVRHIILPQALRHALPPWSNEASAMLKNSSLVYALGVTELLREADYVSARTFQPFVAFGTAAVLYLIFNMLLTRSLRLVEYRLAVPT